MDLQQLKDAAAYVEQTGSISLKEYGIVYVGHPDCERYPVVILRRRDALKEERIDNVAIVFRNRWEGHTAFGWTVAYAFAIANVHGLIWKPFRSTVTHTTTRVSAGELRHLQRQFFKAPRRGI